MNKKDSKISVAIYPYSREFAPVVRYLASLPGYEICAIISPIGWGLTGHDAGYADQGQEIGIIVESDFLSAINKCDTLIVADCNMNYKARDIILQNINIAIDHYKNIICTLKLNESILSDISNKCLHKGVSFKTFNYLFDNNILNVDESLEDIDTPVVFIGGLTEETNKFHVQLSLRKSLCTAGYKVSQIGTRNYCELLGFHSFPGFMYDKGMSEVEKIVCFNKFVKTIEANEEPDIIIIGIPGGMMQYNKRLTNKFAILAYMVSQALSPDFAIVSSAYNEQPPQYFNEIINSFRYKYGFEVNCYNLANSQFDYISSMDKSKFIFNYVDNSLIEEKIVNTCKDVQVPVLNILNNNHISSMCELLVDTLSGYAFKEQIYVQQL